MGKFDFQIPKEFINQLNKLANVEEIEDKMLNAAAPILENKMKAKVKSTYSNPGKKITYIKNDKGIGTYYGHYKQSGALGDSIKATRVKKYKNGGKYIRIYFNGYDEKHVANAEKAMIIEYGTSKESARPFITQVVNDSESSVIDKMQEIFNEEVDK